MPRICYVPKNFRNSTKRILSRADDFIEEYADEGYDLTLRQLYYRFIATDTFPDDWIDEVYNAKHGLEPDTKNTDKNYERLGSIINDGRLAGVLDWDAIVDRTRSLAELGHWASVGAMLKEDAQVYREDKWATQDHRVEVWIEKEALAGVFERICHELDVPYFACRGYVSQSAMWRAGERLRAHEDEGFQTIILHFGDHDPSGIDMTRDIRDRLEMFGSDVDVQRIALTMDQIEEHDPPPNPTKHNDARARGYIAEYGRSCWELDALTPQQLSGLVRDEVEFIRDEKRWKAAVKREKAGTATLKELAEEHAR